MYEELVKLLRSEVCVPYTTMKTMQDAADAIEDLISALTASNEVIAKSKPRWIPVTERLPSDFVSVQAHMTDAGDFPSVREAYVVEEGWFFPALKGFHPVDMWKQFDEPPKEET